MELTGKEIYQVQFLLPIQGDLKTLESVKQILDKLNIKEEDCDDENIRDIELTNPEIIFLENMIQVLSQAKKLNLHGLSLFHKILNNKEQ